MHTRWFTSNRPFQSDCNLDIDQSRSCLSLAIFIGEVCKCGNGGVSKRQVESRVTDKLCIRGSLVVRKSEASDQAKTRNVMFQIQSSDWERLADASEFELLVLRSGSDKNRSVGTAGASQNCELQDVPISNWRTAFSTWVGVCITVGTLSTTAGPFLAQWSWLSQLLLFNAAVVIVLTWIVMPALSVIAACLRIADKKS